MTTATVSESTLRIPLERIRVGGNVRQQLVQEDVDALAGSIELLGVLQPVLVAAIPQDRDGHVFQLVAGYTRYAACKQLGHTDIPVVVRESDEADTAASRGAENVARRQISPYEEAIAVRDMLAKGLTEQGAAQALGWPVARVSARMKLLELPVKAQQMVGAGILPLSHVETLRGIGQVSPDLLGVLVEFLAEEPDHVSSLGRDTTWLIWNALRKTGSKVFVATLATVHSQQIEGLRLGKRATGEYAELGELHKKISSYSYGPPEVRFAETDVDQARAAAVLIEGVGSPLIVDKSLYRELVKQAIARQLQETRAMAAERKAEQVQLKAERPADPEAQARRDHGRAMRGLAAQAHGANTDLGWALRNNLATVDPASRDVAAFFVYALLESADSYYSPDADSDRVTQLATCGIRLVIEEFRTDVTKTRKDGSLGALRIDYGPVNDSTKAREWLWKFVEAGKTAGELYGRALVVIAAEHYASRLVLPVSQQRQPLAWGSRHGKAVKALEKLAGPHIPVSLKQLEKAVVKAKTEYDTELADARAGARKARGTVHGAEHVDTADAGVGEEFDDRDLDGVERFADEDLDLEDGDIED